MIKVKQKGALSVSGQFSAVTTFVIAGLAKRSPYLGKTIGRLPRRRSADSQ
jgi:hypothetical protein